MILKNSGILIAIMNIQKNVSLANYSTMKLGGKARYFIEVMSENDLISALKFATDQNINTHILGGGSNTIFQQSGFDGLVIKNSISGIQETEQDDSLQLKIGGGENWDDVVALSVERGFTDIAGLSKIPGSCGAAPVQNIGAYGQQVSDVLISLRAYDKESQGFEELTKEQCIFLYRSSRFNTTDKHRFIITSITLRLKKKSAHPPFYVDISTYFADHFIDKSSVTPEQLRLATSSVRAIKLPDPSAVANTGSFFKNPTVNEATYDKLLVSYPQLKAHKTDDGSLKLYGAQLIDLAGMKDYHDKETGMATWKNQALVVINEHADTSDDLLEFKQKIIDAVQSRFGITLVQEPELI